MKRITCNDKLELRLATPTIGGAGEEEEEEEEATVFCNGRVATCDVTELQARAIIMLTRRELDRETKLGSTAITGLSIKRSLQRFIQKRKTRSQSASPYSR
ncbi:protein TIFY 5A-like [Primulina eburnea]|uniref:protein TIFY 5A-like n=1 Tax=Primulina eburnea TaxID=1245227 RepID=UPI003C6C26AB